MQRRRSVGGRGERYRKICSGRDTAYYVRLHIWYCDVMLLLLFYPRVWVLF